MSPDLKHVWENMRELGLAALAHANRHAAYWDPMNSRWSEFSILQAAHAAELLMKARIAQEHPLLIFETVPRSNQSSSARLDYEDLFRKGRTIQWADLPERLWATTGVKLYERSRFESFGMLRNGLQHFGPNKTVDHADETLRFIFGVVDPFIFEEWGLFAVDYDEDHEPYKYFVSSLVRREIPFHVSPDAADCSNDWDVDWEETSEAYRKLMHARIAEARRSLMEDG